MTIGSVDRRASAREELQPPPMPVRLPRPEQAGAADRQDVVDEQDGPNVRTSVEPCNMPPPFDGEMGGVQIDGVARRSMDRIVAADQAVSGETGKYGAAAPARLRPEGEGGGRLPALQRVRDGIENAAVLGARAVAVRRLAPGGADTPDGLEAATSDTRSGEPEQQRPGRIAA